MRPLGKHAGAARYKHLTNGLHRAALLGVIHEVQDKLEAAELELKQIHAALYKTCACEGENTCPAWEALEGLRWVMKEGVKRVVEVARVRHKG